MPEPYDLCLMQPCLCRPPPPQVAQVAQDRAEDPPTLDVPVLLPCGRAAPAPEEKEEKEEEREAAAPAPTPASVCKYGESVACQDAPLNGRNHQDVKLLLLGHFRPVGFGDADFDKINQQDKYDPITVDRTVEGDNAPLVAALRTRMNPWRAGLPALAGAIWTEHGYGYGQIQPNAAAPVRGQALNPLQDRVVGARDRSGLIVVTSGRAAALAEALPNMPILVWALARGLAVDIFVDPREFADYKAEIFANDTINAVGVAINAARDAYDTCFPAADFPGRGGKMMASFNLSVVTFPMAPAAPSSLPCGFGYNRYMAFRYMCARFRQGGAGNGRCMMIDDNVADLGGSDYRHLERIFAPRFPTAGDWVCAVFKPCTAAPSNRVAQQQDAASDYRLAAAPTYGPQIQNDTALFIQQLTFWNVVRARALTAEGVDLNYDPFFVTGKEDVSFHARLADRYNALMYEDKSIQIHKIALSPCAPTPGALSKDAATTEALVETNLQLCPCLPYRAKGAGVGYARVSCIAQTLALARRYGLNGAADDIAGLIAGGAVLGAGDATPIEDKFNALVAALVRRQNMVLEQILAKAIADAPRR